MGKTLLSILIFSLLGGLASCTKDDCPTGYLIKVTVKDKNYFNIKEFAQLAKVDEGLPFHYFEGTVFYTLRDPETGALKYQSDVMEVNEGGNFYSINIDNMPAGKYELTVWGNRTKDVPEGILHSNEQEQTDIYVARTELTFPVTYKSVDMALERAKGKLVIFCKNFPASVSDLTANVNSLYSTVNSKLGYSGETTVEKDATVNQVVETFLAPTLEGKTSKLNLNFYALTRAASAPVLTLPEMDVAIHRNEITAITVDYNTTTQNWEIWVYIDGKWKMIHQLNIN